MGRHVQDNDFIAFLDPVGGEAGADILRLGHGTRLPTLPSSVHALGSLIPAAYSNEMQRLYLLVANKRRVIGGFSDRVPQRASHFRTIVLF